MRRAFSRLGSGIRRAARSVGRVARRATSAIRGRTSSTYRRATMRGYINRGIAAAEAYANIGSASNRKSTVSRRARGGRRARTALT